MVYQVRQRDAIELGRWLCNKQGIEQHLRTIEKSLLPHLTSAYETVIAQLLQQQSKQPSFVISGKNYKGIRTLSQTDCSKTYLTVCSSDGNYYIVKVQASTDSNLLARLQQEKQLGQRLQHPAVIKAIDGDQHTLVFRFVQGIDLSTYIKMQRAADQPIPPDHALMIIYRIAEALADIYRNEGVIHRDIKPSNIILNSYGLRLPLVCIIDLGIAKWLKSSEDITSPGTIIGTPSHLAPEALCHEVDSMDERIDIFSLGVLLVNLLQPDIKKNWNIFAYFNWATTRQPTYTPEQLAVFRWNWLIEIIQKMTERDPRWRCSNFEEVMKLCASGMYQYAKIQRTYK